MLIAVTGSLCKRLSGDACVVRRVTGEWSYRLRCELRRGVSLYQRYTKHLAVCALYGNWTIPNSADVDCHGVCSEPIHC
jgi:hypothetical protein